MAIFEIFEISVASGFCNPDAQLYGIYGSGKQFPEPTGRFQLYGIYGSGKQFPEPTGRFQLYGIYGSGKQFPEPTVKDWGAGTPGNFGNL